MKTTSHKRSEKYSVSGHNSNSYNNKGSVKASCVVFLSFLLL